MDAKKQVLIVTNSITDDEVLEIQQAFDDKIAPLMNINLSLVHVIPRLPTCYFNIPSMGILIERYYAEAKKSLNQVGKMLSVTKRNQWLISGKTRTEVLRLANRLSSDFILASAEQIQELQRSLFFKNIHQYTMIKSIDHLKQLESNTLK
ncbi:MAG: hypothetical protein A3F14_02480 [Gammaproteobacteria bacterium RIFCSPHIGHO2_12_FULL_43_28]|nr:MAG: hypothetical protein A3F14_02480 [Gammaproteobacteria bacterium RIFCSPHIGHO2_12_FULL_43_28]